jgi:hypothetical protein
MVDTRYTAKGRDDRVDMSGNHQVLNTLTLEKS